MFLVGVIRGPINTFFQRVLRPTSMWSLSLSKIRLKVVQLV